jgi:hypothetical protein
MAATLSQDPEVLANISVADLLFYRAVELQTSLLQSYRNAILNMAVVAADVATRIPKSAAPEGIKAAKALTDSRKKEAEHALQTAAGKAPSETESAKRNLGNVVEASNLLIHNCVATLQQLDVLADATLAQSVEVILSAVPSS